MTAFVQHPHPNQIHLAAPARRHRKGIFGTPSGSSVRCLITRPYDENILPESTLLFPEIFAALRNADVRLYLGIKNNLRVYI